MQMRNTIFRFFPMGFGLVLLVLASGCAGVRTLDVDVTAYATWGIGGLPAAGSSYRFERLPSQQTGAAADQLETLAREALSRKGWQLAGATGARYSVQVFFNVQQVVAAASYPYGPSVGVGAGVFSGGRGGFGGAGIGFGFPLGGSAVSEYRTELVMLVRNLQNNAPVYETRAYAQAGAPGDPAIIAAMLDSALRDFPVPPEGIRRFTVELAPRR